MTSNCLFVLAFVIFGASQSMACSYSLGGFNNRAGGSSLQYGGMSSSRLGSSQICLQRISNPTVIHNTCDCFKTILTPQIHENLFTVPSTQRLIQTIPVVQSRSSSSPLFHGISSEISRNVYPRIISGTTGMSSANTGMPSLSNFMIRNLGSHSGSYPMRESYLGNSMGGISGTSGSSFSRIIPGGYSNNGVVVPGSSLINCGFMSGGLNGGY